MSETNNNILSHSITAPSMNDVNYASSISAVFDNINDNFIQLANHDFVKGDAGNSVMIKEVDIVDSYDSYGNPIFTEIGNKLVECINNAYSSNELADIEHENTVITVWDKFKQGNNPGKLQMVYNIDVIDGVNKIETPASSLYYVFLDGRYNTTKIKDIDEANYQKIIDASCIVVYNGVTDKFDILRNAFPTIYYESGVGLCWKVNGNGTGIPVQGIQGKDGIDTKLYIVKSTNSYNTEGFEVTSIYDGMSSYIDVNEYLTSANNKFKNNQLYTAVIYCPKDSDTNNINGLYFGSIALVNNKLIAYCDTENSLDATVQYNTFVNALRLIDLKNVQGENLPGLFIPIETTKSADSNAQKVHLLTATSITNYIGDISNKNTDIVWTAIDDINTIQLTDEKKLQVEKYLYIKVNKNELDNLCKGYDESVKTNIDTILQKYNYILKYKLQDTVNVFNLTIFDYNNEGDFESIKAMCIPFDNINKVCFYDKKNNYDNNPGTEYIKPDTYKDAGIATFPSEFKTKISSGIYRWTIDMSYNTFDPKELIECPNHNFDSETSKYSEAYTIAESDKKILSLFKTIFTDTISPTLNSTYMWFNGLTKYIDAIEGVTGKYSFEPNLERKVIYGWEYNNQNLFKMIKFVPSIINDFGIDDDTALNVNYNINILGDKKNTTKNLTVHGGVNCEDLQVCRLSADEIKNIYTKDNIVTENGIQIGYKPGLEEVNAAISTDGTITTVSDVISTGGSIYADLQAIADSFTTKTGLINAAETTGMNPENIDSVTKQGIIQGVNINKINILRPKGPEQYYQQASTFAMSRVSRAAGFDTGVDREHFQTEIQPWNPNINIDGSGGGFIGVSGGINIGGGNTNNDDTLTEDPETETPDNPETPDNNTNEGAGDTITECTHISLKFNASKVVLTEGTKTTKLKLTVITDYPAAFNDSNKKGIKAISISVADNIIGTQYDITKYSDTNKIIPITVKANTDKLGTETSKTVILTATVAYGLGVDRETISATCSITVNKRNETSSAGIVPSEDNITKIAEYQPEVNITVPINSNNNTPIIVSDTNINSQQLCVSGLAGNYWDGNFEHPFNEYEVENDGTTNVTISNVKHKYIEDIDFDTVKNFNMHRLSLNKLGSFKETSTVLTQILDCYSNTYNNLSSYIKNGYRQLLGRYDRSDDTNRIGAEFIDTNKYIHKVTIQRTDNDDILNFNSKIELVLNKVYNILLGINAETSYGNNPIFKKDSYLRLHLYCKVGDNGELVKINNKTKEIKFTDNDLIWSTSYSYLYTDSKAVGSEQLLKMSNSAVDSISGNKKYDMRWRFRSFNFKLDSFDLSVKYLHEADGRKKTIQEFFNNGDKITFYIVPEYKIEIATEKDKDILRGVYTTIPVPINESSKPNESTVMINKGNDYGKYNGLSNSSELKCEYIIERVITNTDENGSIKSATLTKNGIVFRDNLYTFGIGFSNCIMDHSIDNGYALTNQGIEDRLDWSGAFNRDGSPILFYHKYDDRYYHLDDKQTIWPKTGQYGIGNAPEGGNFPEGFARRMHAIPLEDIFNVIKHIRETEDEWKQFGV